MCRTLNHTQVKLMAMWISIGYSRTADTNTIEMYSIGTDINFNACIGGTLKNECFSNYIIIFVFRVTRFSDIEH